MRAQYLLIKKNPGELTTPGFDPNPYPMKIINNFNEQQFVHLHHHLIFFQSQL